MNRLAILIIIFLLSSCARIDEEVVFHWKVIESAGDFAQFVDPMIGTAGHGHTFPGATAPFGMVQLSPDTRVDGSWDGCSGYHYSDSVIFGFSHTHLSGTGCSDYGDILLMPGKGEIHYTNGTDGKRGYGSRFSHADEKAEAGYYSVELVDPGIKAELTASPRVGMHRYSNPEWIVLDLAHRDEVLATHLEVVNDHTIRGYRFSKAWATDQRLWFYAEFSEP
ncbi:MAG TPA: glycoside hydrolase family 92 protein, partial [Bacteroidia bacterium]|nr:glycoside hydrolase family 92 protein [Bacteroidia bacterium]